MYMDVMAEMLGTGVLIAVPGLVLTALVMRALRRSPAFVQRLACSLLLTVALTPTVALRTPHGARGFPAVLALIGNGPRGLADVLPLGVLPITTVWVLIFAFSWLRSHRRDAACA
jgi:hypothetical protein